MTASAKVEHMERLRMRIQSLVGPEHYAMIAQANDKSASEFMRIVQQIIPRGDAEDGNLVDTLRKSSPGGVASQVSIGGPGQQYVMHLEAGHRNRDGTVTPGKPFWNPTKRVVKKKNHLRVLRAERAAIKHAASKGA